MKRGSTHYEQDSDLVQSSMLKTNDGAEFSYMDMASRGDGELDELKMQLLQGVKAVTDL